MNNLVQSAIEQIIAGNTDNAIRHRLQGTDEDIILADRYDRRTALLQEDLADLLKERTG